MSLTAGLIIVPGICYAVAACLYAAKRDWALTVVYSGYAWANAGLWLIDRRGI